MDYAGFIGGNYQSRSSLAACQQVINFYPERVEASSRTPAALYPTAGQQLFTTTADVVGRAAFTISDRTHFLMGGGFYEVFSTGTSTKRGTVAQDSRQGRISYNGNAGNQLLVSSGGTLTYCDLTTNALTTVTGVPFSDVTDIGMIDGFFAALDVGLNRIYVSPLNDMLGVWDPTQFIQRTTQPDRWRAMVIVPPNIWAIGELTGDVLLDAGTSPFPLAPRQGITFRYGTRAPASVAVIGDSPIWLATDKDGIGVVVQTRGYQPFPISDKALETAIAGYARASTIDDAEAFVWKFDGHQTYVLSFPSVPATWAYDLSTQLWYQLGTWNAAMAHYDVWSPRVHTVAFGKHLVADHQTGRICELDGAFTTESDGSAIRRVIVPPPLWPESQRKRMFISYFGVVLEPGLGTPDGQGADPQVLLRVSRDTKTWSSQRTCSAGRQGDYGKRVCWWQNGSSTLLWVPELVFSDPVQWRVIGAEFEGKNVRGPARSAAA